MYSIEVNLKDLENAKNKYKVFNQKFDYIFSTLSNKREVNDLLYIECAEECKDKLSELFRFASVGFKVNGREPYRDLGRFNGDLIILLSKENIDVDPTKIIEYINNMGIELTESSWDYSVRNNIAFKLGAPEEYSYEYNPFRELQDILDESGIKNEVCII